MCVIILECPAAQQGYVYSCKGTTNPSTPYQRVVVHASNVCLYLSFLSSFLLYFFLFLHYICRAFLSCLFFPFFFKGFKDLEGTSPELLPGAIQTILPGREVLVLFFTTAIAVQWINGIVIIF